MIEIIVGLIGAVAAIVTALITRYYTRRDLDRQLKEADDKAQGLEKDLGVANRQVTTLTSSREDLLKSVAQSRRELTELQDDLAGIRTTLADAGVVEHYDQPVLLLGPRYVGKTSLLTQWQAPWSREKLISTPRHNVSTVPVYDFEQENAREHFAVPGVMTRVTAHIKLRVHDFPGELESQADIVEKAIEESASVIKMTKKNLGVVLILLFDAEEAAQGRLRDRTISYYNGDLFNQLGSMIGHGRVGVQKVVLVFNKYDLLREAFPEKSDSELMKQCLSEYSEVLRRLSGVCNRDRFCEVFTILDRDDMVNNNKGAPVVLGEAARDVVRAVAGSEAAERVAPQRGGTTVQAKLPDLE